MDVATFKPMFRQAGGLAILCLASIISFVAIAEAGPRRCSTHVLRNCFPNELVFVEGWPKQGDNRPTRTLAKPFSYVDPKGYLWKVPAGFPTDGASIPRVFQPITGGRWTADYIRAAVVHDYYIGKWYKFPSAVHRVFYDALLASGTDPGRARQLYVAVDNFGPVWGNKLRTRWTDQARLMWDAFKQQEDRIVAHNKRYSKLLNEGYRQVLERDRKEARLAPHQRMRLKQIRTERDMAEALGQVLKQVVPKTNDELKKCRLMRDGSYDCGTVDLRR